MTRRAIFQSQLGKYQPPTTVSSLRMNLVARIDLRCRATHRRTRRRRAWRRRPGPSSARRDCRSTRCRRPPSALGEVPDLLNGVGCCAVDDGVGAERARLFEPGVDDVDGDDAGAEGLADEYRGDPLVRCRRRRRCWPPATPSRFCVWYCCRPCRSSPPRRGS